jgi:2-aminoethylphosphonate-pyruvate transaminase
MILLSPGPVNVSERVRAALAGPDLCHREPEYARIQSEARRLLQELFAPDHAVALLTGSGTAAVEAAIASLVPEGAPLLVANNGVYGERIAAIARVHCIDVREVRFPWTEPVDPDALARHAAGAAAVALVHHETTTGLINPVSDVARRLGLPTIVDSVSGLGGEAIVASDFDAVVSTANKCLQGVPGVSFVLVRRDRLGAARRSYALDLARYVRDEVPFTPAVPAMAALVEALRELETETVEGRIARYRALAAELRAGFHRLGLEPLLPPRLRSNTITTLRLPPAVPYRRLHDALKRDGFVIYQGQQALAESAFRVANMGCIPPREAARFLERLEAFLVSACTR